VSCGACSGAISSRQVERVGALKPNWRQFEGSGEEFKSARKKTSVRCTEQTLLTPIENKKWAPDARVM
jgi:hypothetical protein